MHHWPASFSSHRINTLTSFSSFLLFHGVTEHSGRYVCQCSFELHFISTPYNYRIRCCCILVSMLFRASLHFYELSEVGWNAFLKSCQCSSELHFISTFWAVIHCSHWGLCQCSSELHFISTIVADIGGGLYDHLCQCSSELHFISTVIRLLKDEDVSCVNALPSFTSFLLNVIWHPWSSLLFVSMLFRASLHFYRRGI